MQLTTRTSLSMVKMERKNRLPCMWMPEKTYKKWEGSTKTLLHTQLARNSEGRGGGAGTPYEVGKAELCCLQARSF